MPRKPTTLNARPARPRPIAVRMMVWFVVWWMARLPVAVPDFHEVDHHHDSGQTCLYHEHLSRWHADDQTPAAEHQALLHWHWLIPGSSAQDSQNDPQDEEPGSGQATTDSFAIIGPEHQRFDALGSFVQENARAANPLISPTTHAGPGKVLCRKIQNPELDFTHGGSPRGSCLHAGASQWVEHLTTLSSNKFPASRPLRC